MKSYSQLSLVLLASLLGGCALFSPDYVQPQVAAPTVTRNGTAIESSNQDLSQVQWWKKMNDPVLNQLISAGLANNNQIQEAQGNILQAQAQLKAAQYAWLPTLSGTGGAFAGNSWGTNFTPQGALAGNSAVSSGSLGNTNFSGYYGGFVPSYSFNVFHNINQTKYAKASLDLQKAALNASRLSIIGQISGSYFMLLGQKKQLKLQQQMVKDLQELRQLEQRKFENGASDLSNVAIIDQEISSYQAQIPVIENSIAQTENSLQLLLNKNPGPIISSADIADLNVNGLVPANLPSGILKNRPDIIQAEDNLKMANANVGLANSIFFPNISLTGIIGGDSIALSNLFTASGGFWAGQAAASMPILNASSFEQVSAAKGGYYVAYYNYMQTVKSAFADVDNSLTKHQKMNQQYQATAQSLHAAQQFLRISQAKNTAGAKDYSSVVGAKLDVDNVALQLNQAKMQQLDSLVVVYQSLAGGYAAESELSKVRKTN